MVAFLKAVLNHFFNGNTFQKGAALAYYAVFSIIPIIIMAISVLGLFFGEQSVSGEVFTQLKDVIGSKPAMQIQSIIKEHHTNYNSFMTAIVGFATLLLSASGMFSQIHNAFNNLWNIKAKPRNSIVRYFTKHLSSFVLLMALFFMLIISTTIHAFLMHHSTELQSNYSLSLFYEHAFSITITTCLFAFMFKFLGDAKVHWKPAIIAGAFTAILFALGKIGIAIIIGKSHVTSTFGSASILALIMLWVYYTSQIIFLGASFLKVLSDTMHLPILANKNAVKIIQQEVGVND